MLAVDNEYLRFRFTGELIERNHTCAIRLEPDFLGRNVLFVRRNNNSEASQALTPISIQTFSRHYIIVTDDVHRRALPRKRN